MARFQWRKSAKLILAIALLGGLILGVLPRIERIRCLEVVRNNARSDIEATAYFYTEINGFGRFEEAVGEIFLWAPGSPDGSSRRLESPTR